MLTNLFWICHTQINTDIFIYKFYFICFCIIIYYLSIMYFFSQGIFYVLYFVISIDFFYLFFVGVWYGFFVVYILFCFMFMFKQSSTVYNTICYVLYTIQNYWFKYKLHWLCVIFQSKFVLFFVFCFIFFVLHLFCWIYDWLIDN